MIPRIDPQAAATETKSPSNQSQTEPVGSAVQAAKFQLPRFGFGKKPLYILAGILGFLLLLFLLTFFPARNFYAKAKAFAAEGRKFSDVAKGGKIGPLKAELGNLKKSYADLKKAYAGIAWLKFVPIGGRYVSDAGHGINAVGFSLDAADIGISAVEPYADILGFGDKKESDGKQTTQERIDFVIKSLPSLTPKAGDIAAKIDLAKKEIDQINPDKYPVKFQGKEVRSQLKAGIDLFDTMATYVENAKPMLEALPYIIGVDTPRTYLVMFQNDKELRPTGGFMTAYAIVTVDKGKFSPGISSDIYDLDARYTPTLKAPDPIVKYIKGPYTLNPRLLLRDTNWSPDFKESMKLFTTEAKKAGVTDIDGVIAVDTQLLVNVLKAIGTVGVGGYGNFSTEIVPQCNCPQVIYELESFASIEGPIVWSQDEPGKIIYAPPNYQIKKKVIGPLMNSILANALGQPKDKLPGLFEAAFKSLAEKHVLFYLFDAKAQSGVEAFNIAGKIKDASGDYLEVNDANLGGRKSNLYATQEVEQDIKVAGDGSIEKTLIVTYKNPMKQDGWLNSVLPNWVRIYVPKGSQLVSADGFEEKAAPYEDLGKTVFAGFFQLRPEGVAKITLRYKLPFKISKGDYYLLIQKQPGKDAPLYTVQAGRQSEEFFLREDKELRLSF